MAAGITQKTFLGFRNSYQSCFSTSSGALSYLRRNPKYRTIEDSVRSKTPVYDLPDKEEYNKDGPRWKGLNMRELYNKDRTRNRILVRAPDYSFVDGRPTPIGGCMKKRLEIQMGWAEKIVQYSNEMDFAVERHAAMQKAVEDAKRKIIESKLKPKGKLLSNPDNNSKPVEVKNEKLVAESKEREDLELERKKAESLAASLKDIENKWIRKEKGRKEAMKNFKAKIPLVKRLKRFDKGQTYK